MTRQSTPFSRVYRRKRRVCFTSQRGKGDFGSAPTKRRSAPQAEAQGGEPPGERTRRSGGGNHANGAAEGERRRPFSLLLLVCESAAFSPAALVMPGVGFFYRKREEGREGGRRREGRCLFLSPLSAADACRALVGVVSPDWFLGEVRESYFTEEEGWDKLTRVENVEKYMRHGRNRLASDLWKKVPSADGTHRCDPIYRYRQGHKTTQRASFATT